MVRSYKRSLLRRGEPELDRLRLFTGRCGDWERAVYSFRHIHVQANTLS